MDALAVLALLEGRDEEAPAVDEEEARPQARGRLPVRNALLLLERVGLVPALRPRLQRGCGVECGLV